MKMKCTPNYRCNVMLGNASFWCWFLKCMLLKRDCVGEEISSNNISFRQLMWWTIGQIWSLDWSGVVKTEERESFIRKDISQNCWFSIGETNNSWRAPFPFPPLIILPSKASRKHSGDCGVLDVSVSSCLCVLTAAQHDGKNTPCDH